MNRLQTIVDVLHSCLQTLHTFFRMLWRLPKFAEKGTKMNRIRISNETLNQYGTWIKTEGVDLTQFKRNPVMLWMHERGKIIGCIKNISVENNEITGEPYFDEVTEESRQAKQQWEKGTLRMGSPRFEVIDLSDAPELLKPGQTRPTVTKCKLVEFSMVDIGGNDDNIRLSRDGKDIILSKSEDNAGDEVLPVLNNVKKQNKMNELKTIALMLGLAEGATLQEVQQKINVILGYQSANATLRTERDDLKKQLETMQLAGVTALVDDAIKAGKIDATKKDHFINLGKSVGQESLKLTFDAMHGSVKPTTVINAGGNGGAKNGKYQKLSEVPLEEMKLMRKEDPQEYRRLYKLEYGVDCPELSI